ncbi:MAG TPA: O-methyltransferase [Vicinamibacterales bacterium]
MSNITPQPIVDYLAGLRADPHERLALIDREGRAEGLPLVYPDTGALLHTLARGCGATRILEIGTCIGYSTLWLATALPATGAVITMEYDAARAARARDHFAAAGYADRVSVIVGDATRFLHKVGGPFDLIFQDSDKQLYEPMLERLVELLRPGGLLVADNVLWNGEVIPGFVRDKKYSDKDTNAIIDFSRRVARDARLYTSFLQVGDGVSVSVKRA